MQLLIFYILKSKIIFVGLLVFFIAQQHLHMSLKVPIPASSRILLAFRFSLTLNLKRHIRFCTLFISICLFVRCSEYNTHVHMYHFCTFRINAKCQLFCVTLSEDGTLTKSDRNGYLWENMLRKVNRLWSLFKICFVALYIPLRNVAKF